jgi:RNA polymerase sigma factor (TIGR02999 family)
MSRSQGSNNSDDEAASGVVTRVLRDASLNAPGAVGELFAVVYQELHRMARARMTQERAEHTLQATALVHEAYLRLVGDGNVHWDGRGHFFTAAAEAMRRILIEHARHKHAIKSGGGHYRVEWTDDLPQISSPCDIVEDLLALNEALDQFALEDPGKADLVKLLYFAGLNLDEAAAVMNISRTTAYRHWIYARAWLHEAVNGGKKPP